LDQKADGVLGLLEKLRLSETERRGLKISGAGGEIKGRVEP
jgi:hypothetical protein